MPIHKEHKNQPTQQRRDTSNTHQMQSKQNSKDAIPNYEALIPPPLQLSSESPYKTLEDRFRPPEERGKPLQKREMPTQLYKIDETKWGHTETKQPMLSGSMDAIFQRVLSREAAAKQQTQNPETSSNAPLQKKENKTGLPDNLKSGIENLSGFSMDDVKVHYNSSKPVQLQAHAYAQGSNIHLAPGQEKHLPHEAWHVVQQKQGRVKPTMQMKGVNVNDDVGLEREADVMGHQLKKMPSKPSENLNSSRLTSFTKPIQRVATPTKRKQQEGGTCGLYSLYMAISSFDNTITIEEILNKGEEEGTFVGEFMDAAKLVNVANKISGVKGELVSFETVDDLKDKLSATGDKGVIIAYVEAKYYGGSGHGSLSGIVDDKSYLLSHWSVVESLNEVDKVVTLWNPNVESKETDPETKLTITPSNNHLDYEMSINELFKQNEYTEQGAPKRGSFLDETYFSFAEFEGKLGSGRVKRLREKYTQNSAVKRNTVGDIDKTNTGLANLANSTENKKEDSHVAPTLSLKGVFITVESEATTTI